jgi:4-amino-4-deoxy-L-arabinose transferase-like glycosyltransferase
MTGEIRNVDQTPPELFVWAGRSMNAVLGACTVLLTGLLGRSVSGPVAGLLAAALMAVTPLSLDTSTMMRNDVGMVFFVTACALAAQMALATPRRRSILAAGVLAGCATGTKYTAVFTLLPASLAALLPSRGRQRWVYLGLCVSGFAAAVALTNHFVWVDFSNFVRQLSMDLGHVNKGHWAFVDNPGWAYVSVLAHDGAGWPLLVLAGGFVAVGLATHDRRVWVLAAFPLAYMWLMTQKPAMFPRWVYPLMPFAAVAGAAGLVCLVTAATRVRGMIVGTRLRVGHLVTCGVVVASPWPASWAGPWASAGASHLPPTHWRKPGCPSGPHPAIGCWRT